jgi:hypothetical protein
MPSSGDAEFLAYMLELGLPDQGTIGKYPRRSGGRWVRLDHPIDPARIIGVRVQLQPGWNAAILDDSMNPRDVSGRQGQLSGRS